MSAVRSDLPQFLRDMLASPPRAGDGVHRWQFQVARHLHAHRSEKEMYWLLKTSLEECGRDVPDREIWAAIRDSKAVAWKFREHGEPVIEPKSKWPEPHIEEIDTLVRSGPGLCDLQEDSFIRFDDAESHAEQIVDTLFPGNPKLCCARSEWLFATRRREVWRGRLNNLPLIVPNPMTAFEGYTKTGHISEHTLSATGRRVYQAIEFDFSLKARDGITDTLWAPLVRAWEADDISVLDACAALIFHLRKRLPRLVCACYSGGKSLHSWFRIFELDRIAQRQFMDLAVSIGADPATWCRSQLVRIPDGMRDNGRRQTAHYLDPREAIQ